VRHLHRVTRLAEQPREHLHDGAIVVDDQNVFRCTAHCIRQLRRIEGAPGGAEARDNFTRRILTRILTRVIFRRDRRQTMETELTYTVFAGHKLLCSGDRRTMLLRTKQAIDRGAEQILIFEDQTGRQVDFDFRGSADELLARELESKPRSGPGRPRLGVVSREVSLLPRHWEWLEQQSQGISGALRRLVEEASKREPGKQRARIAREAASRFMWSMAGDLPGFEEATRALFAKDDKRLAALIRKWPADIRAHVQRLVEHASELEDSDANAP
jgi:hypothetical protein